MTRRLLDVNALAILLVESHPGHDHVSRLLEPGLRGEDTVLVYSYLPFRAHWVMTTKWDVDRVVARNAVSSFLEQPVRVVDADNETIHDAYELSAEKNHDVYDCFHLALARRHGADALVTTDTDFKRLCADEQVVYQNPVPGDVLSTFAGANTEE